MIIINIKFHIYKQNFPWKNKIKEIKSYFVACGPVQKPTQIAWLAPFHTILHEYDFYFQAG